MPIGRVDIKDSAVVDAVELGSDGTTKIFTGVTVVSTTSSTKRVALSGIYIIHGDVDEILEAGDLVTLSGTSAADGNYTIDTIVDDTTFDVVEAIADSTGGTCEVAYPPGARKVGVDPSSLTISSATELQQVLEDFDAGISAGGITAAQHKALRQLIHFIASGPGDGFSVGNPYRETTYSGIKETDEVWYEDNTKAKKIYSVDTTWTGIKITGETSKVYQSDGSSVAAQAVDAISYSGIKESNRTRTITVY